MNIYLSTQTAYFNQKVEPLLLLRITIIIELNYNYQIIFSFFPSSIIFRNDILQFRMVHLF